ncbi:thioredoxin family protein [Rosistilla oblonga]|uniref:thioredoxin family protein n=1 Tax=Rosistilla oblonga TaxID=2527990 RepID=UPI003A97267A
MTTDDSVSNASFLTAAPTNASRKRFFHFWRCFWLAFLVISLGYAWYCFYVPANRVAWADNFQTAQQQAVAEDKPMVLFFTGQWCVPCRIMKRTIWADDQVSALVNESLVPVAIDIYDPRSNATIARYHVGATPLTVVTDSTGNVVQWKQGGMSKAEFLELLDEAKELAES